MAVSMYAITLQITLSEDQLRRAHAVYVCNSIMCLDFDIMYMDVGHAFFFKPTYRPKNFDRAARETTNQFGMALVHISWWMQSQQVKCKEQPLRVYNLKLGLVCVSTDGLFFVVGSSEVSTRSVLGSGPLD